MAIVDSARGTRRTSHAAFRVLRVSGCCLLGLVLLMVLSAPDPMAAATAAPVPKAVLVLVDGVPADVIERVATPHLDAIADRGGYTRAQVGGAVGTATETPTVSAPGYMSLLTGTWANKHRVRGNYDLEPDYNYWSLFRLAKAVTPALQTGVFSTWTDNRTVLLGAGLPETGALAIDHVADGFEQDSSRFPPLADDRHIQQIDRHVAAEAARVLSTHGPDLSWVYLQYTDDVGHALGDGPEFDAAVGVMDELVGQIWDAVQQRQHRNAEDWLVLVTTDHGRDVATGRDHGGQSPRERRIWMVTNSARLTDDFHGQATIVDIYPSIAAHLGIIIPQTVAAGLEGRSFIAPAGN